MLSAIMFACQCACVCVVPAHKPKIRTALPSPQADPHMANNVCPATLPCPSASAYAPHSQLRPCVSYELLCSP